MPLILREIWKAYGEKEIVRNFSYAFPKSGVVLVRGASGSGKTTLLRMIAGLTRPDRGSVEMPPQTRLSMVFQEDRLLPTLDARGNILAVLGERTPDNLRLADACLARCGLAGEERRYPAQLSGGMRRRVAIARAMAYGGDLLLLDEPFKEMDPQLKERVMDFVFKDRDRLILLVSHDPAEIARADHWLEAKAFLND